MPAVKGWEAKDLDKNPGDLALTPEGFVDGSLGRRWMTKNKHK